MANPKAPSSTLVSYEGLLHLVFNFLSLDFINGADLKIGVRSQGSGVRRVLSSSLVVYEVHERLLQKSFSSNSGAGETPTPQEKMAKSGMGRKARLICLQSGRLMTNDL